MNRVTLNSRKVRRVNLATCWSHQTCKDRNPRVVQLSFLPTLPRTAIRKDAQDQGPEKESTRAGNPETKRNKGSKERRPNFLEF